MRHVILPLVTLLLVAAPALANAQSPSPDPTDAFDTVPAVVKRPARPRAESRSWAELTGTGLAPRWTYGTSLPITRFGFARNADGTYGGSVTPLQAGVGVNIYCNLVRSADGGVPLGIGAMLFGATDLAASESDSGLGIAIGPSFFNNHFAVMAGVDLYRRIGSQDTGLLMAEAGGRNGFARQNVFVLFNFGIGLGQSAPGPLKIAP